MILGKLFAKSVRAGLRTTQNSLVLATAGGEE
jgi:hypothetical protein